MKLVEIFSSLQGEGVWTGTPMTFVRVAGCPVACPFCDTDYNKGYPITIPQILEECYRMGNRRVCLTGGEPLAIPEVVDGLLPYLCEEFKVHIETSGCYDCPDDMRPWYTVSPKGSWLGAKKDFLDHWFEYADEFKILVPSTPQWLINSWMTKSISEDTPVFFQPENFPTAINHHNLALAEREARKWQARLSVQLHKVFHWR